ncbi:MAG: hypothetical protein JXP37_07665, partial [Coriobacteriia bacterium]|nr:hypothetical protein [Coriobacteriia bacterium]
MDALELILYSRGGAGGRSPYRKIYGVTWNPTESTPTLTRTDAAVGMTAAVGGDGAVVANSFDTAP